MGISLHVIYGSKATGTVSVKYLPCKLQLTYPNANPKDSPPPLSKVRVRVSYIFYSDLLFMTCRLELLVEGSMGTKFQFGQNYDPEPQS